MVGCIKGLAFFKEQNGNVIATHCFLQREILMSGTLRKKLAKILDQVVQRMSFNKTRSVKSRLFE